MKQWEADLGRASPVAQVLDMEDITYILHEEPCSTWIVLGRTESSCERLIGYSYAYLEPFEAGSPEKPRKHHGRRGNKIVGPFPGRVLKAQELDEQQSLYIAELFVVESERGVGFGELLLCETLR